MNALIKETAANILSFVQSKESVTAWQIKMQLRLKSSLLYLSLGELARDGKIEIEEQGLDYKVKPVL